MAEPTHIDVVGSNVHNLQDVDVRVPRNALTVFTGVSGSGKSSLAFDTIYKEGQRRFMESLSSYARQFLGQMERPNVEKVTGVSPTLSIDQKTVNRNPRSTVGTVTEIYDHLRLWMARLGTPHCPKCDSPIQNLSLDAIVDRILETATGKRVIVLGPIIRERKGEYRKELEGLHREGWVRARIDGEIRYLDQPIELARYEKHTIEVVVDRLKPNVEKRSRLAEAIEKGLELGKGTVGLLVNDEPFEFSTLRACATHPELSIPEMEPRLFSFNAPQGCCPACDGLGRVGGFEAERILDLNARLPDAVLPFNDQGKIPFSHLDTETLLEVAKGLKLPIKKPLRKWSAEELDCLLYGEPSYTYETVVVRDSGRTDRRTREWLGILGFMERIWHFTKHKGFVQFRMEVDCPDCDGTRLNAVARSVRYRGTDITELGGLALGALRKWFQAVVLTAEEHAVGALLLGEILDRLQFLDDVGLGYLSLDRGANTLSGGEAQRIRLASQVGSALQGVTYVLDEPSIGLHPRDNARLLQTLFRLRDRGNTVLVVEHDEETIRAADHVVDVGPKAGRNGGHIVVSGPPSALYTSQGLTGEYLRGDRVIAPPSERRKGNGHHLRVRKANKNNLRDVDVSIPLGTLTVVTGVSGSGKSSLVFGVVQRSLHEERPVACASFKGGEHIDKMVSISQSPIGRTPRSNPATYVGMFDVIRGLFSNTLEAKARGYKKGRFSFNVKGGRCEACEGAGVKTIEMQFLPSVSVVCDVCKGQRFNAETLDIRWKNHTIADVLALTVDEALALFEKIPRLKRILQTMVDVGLGYVGLGQPSTTLSGGEAQRIKLSKELHRPNTGNTLYIMDEPTTGLHLHDVSLLLTAIQRLVSRGNTVVVIEHHGDIIQAADFILDIGPDGGIGGGHLVAKGTPEKIAKADTPTGQFLRSLQEDIVQPKSEELEPETEEVWIDENPFLIVDGAAQNNLKEVSVRIPHNQLTVISGVSGSGKSSLAFDTIFSEGQRRYVESLSTYARRFLGRLDRAPVERLEGLKPAIAIDQKSVTRNPRSTVATMTEIHDVLRVLYARIGQCHCPKCDRPLRSHDPSFVARALKKLDAGAGWLVADLPGHPEPQQLRTSLQADGWTRVLTANATQVDLADEASVSLLKKGAQLVVDRVKPKSTANSRLSEAVRSAFALGGGRVRFIEKSSSTSWEWMELATCPKHGAVLLAPLEPRNFSFNSRLGACIDCQGLGMRRDLVLSRLFPYRDLGFWDALDGRVSATLRRSSRNRALVTSLFTHLGSDAAVPVKKWSPKIWAAILDGLPNELQLQWKKQWGRTSQQVEETRVWTGLRSILKGWNSSLDWLMDEQPCPGCNGARIQPAFVAVRIGNQSIHGFTSMTVSDAHAFVHSLQLEGEHAAIGERPLQEIRRRLSFLRDVGLGYLGLERAASTLSGGEAQRIRLASQLGSGLSGVVYVLDEPTIGLHAKDTERLLSTLEELRDIGNTVVMVEHDLDTIRTADYLIDLGPKAGIEGGYVVAQGHPDVVAGVEASPTGRWMSGLEQMDRPLNRRKKRATVALRGARIHNLSNVSLSLPTGVLVGVSGVSGSGKSSLLMDSFVPAVKAHIAKEPITGPWSSVKVGETVDKMVVVDQSPIGRTPRSTPATYCKLLGPIRELFSTTGTAKERGYAPGRFSYNAKTGRCTLCEGRGVQLFEMHFLPDVWVECVECKGSRYNRETLQVRWRGKNMADVLNMRADEALPFFANQRRIARGLQALVDVGLGYLQLGQAATTLSGGEAQRVKLAAELTSKRGHCLYVLDEPTTGLHMQDVRALVDVLHRLVDQGHTVWVVEHHLDVLWQCDYLVEMGPEGGDLGGQVVAKGTPEKVARADCATGHALVHRLR